MNNSSTGVWVVLSFLIGILIGGAFGTIVPMWDTGEIRELGQTICEEEYGMDFESYVDKTLRCKPFKESYDGLQVEIPKDTISKRKIYYEEG